MLYGFIHSVIPIGKHVKPENVQPSSELAANGAKNVINCQLQLLNGLES